MVFVQVEFAKKIMFEQQKEDPLPRRNNRRETWCPGRSAWAPPLAGECCRCRGGRPQPAAQHQDSSSSSGMQSDVLAVLC